MKWKRQARQLWRAERVDSFIISSASLRWKEKLFWWMFGRYGGWGQGVRKGRSRVGPIFVSPEPVEIPISAMFLAMFEAERGMDFVCMVKKTVGVCRRPNGWISENHHGWCRE
jgi:hypothetical protein